MNGQMVEDIETKENKARVSLTERKGIFCEKKKLKKMETIEEKRREEREGKRREEKRGEEKRREEKRREEN